MAAPTQTLLDAMQAWVRSPLQRTKIDVHRTPTTPVDISDYVSEVSTTCALTSDVPDSARMVTGYSTAEADLTLGGDRTNNDHNASWLFSPYNTASPFYGTKRMGAPTTVELGFHTTAGEEYEPVFTGALRSMKATGHAAGSMTALDNSELLRLMVQLPMVTAQGHPGLTGRYFVDYILAQAGITGSDLEPSLNPLVCTPWTSDKQNAWTLIQQIAAAELAVAFFTPDGVFHFWNRDHFRLQSVDYDAGTVTVPSGATSAIRQVTALRDLKECTSTEAIDAVKNHVQVNYTAYQIQPFDFIWQSNDPVRLGIKQTRTIWATFDNPVINLRTALAWMGPGYALPDGHSGYRACRRQDGTGDAVTNLQFTVTAFANQAKITITNPNPYWCYLVSPKKKGGDVYDDSVVGQPMLWLRGQAVVDSASATTSTSGSAGAMVDITDAQSVTDFDDQLYTHDAGGWIQSADAADAVARYLRRSTARPVPTLDDVAVVGDPTRRLGDRVELVDPGMSMSGEHAWIVGIANTYSIGEDATSDGGFSQSLTLRMCAPIGGWILGHPTRSKLGVSTVLGGVY